MRDAGVARFPGARGRIPNFTGAEEAARRLCGTPEWERAGVLKANPDLPQLPVRAAALSQGKVVYVAVPRLAADLPFLALDPDRLTASPRRAASIKGASSEGVPIGFDAMAPIDLIVCGSVAVNGKGVRIGKGGGYSDLEFALAREAGVIGDWTTVATTVHGVQVLDEDLPETPHDFRVDLIVTPEEIIRSARKRGERGLRGPAGILWADLDKTKIAAIPELRRWEKLRPDRGNLHDLHD
ncbi:MAG: 5-formyltetrahydrofolate cyclo-ligase [Actinomycetota bacterium]|nr:5-formyltetrahydrofolate cyclo-ligase [Actinomycetota bacterium]